MNLAPLCKVGVFSRGLAKLPGLTTFVGCEGLVFQPSAREARSLDAVIGWGHKPTARRAREFARAHGVPYLALEDGFLRSVGIGAKEAPLSLVLDDVGIYYDAGEPSRIERWLAEDSAELTDPALLERARRCRARIVESDLSKYNLAPHVLPPELEKGDPYVVVGDQTFDDASVTLGASDARTFTRMLERARDEHPGARIVVKVHPETLLGRKRGYLAELTRDSGAIWVGDVSPQRLLSRAKHVYVCTSQLGFDALLAGVKVSCFGAPFYAGWGLTQDHVQVPRRGRTRSLDELVAAALLLYPRYVDPFTGERTEVETVIEHLALQRRLLCENRRNFVCFGFSAWKRPFVRRYLAARGGSVSFARKVERARCDADSTLVVWASKLTPALERFSEQEKLPLWRMEDGFLRSVGLGSDLTAPGSLVLDRQGIYYDPRTPSDLEELLLTSEFSEEELKRARALRERIVQAGISKYNNTAGHDLKLSPAPGQRVVLVVGQVDDDASVRLGSPLVRSNRELLRAVRAERKDAYLVYKPHPDVESGNRRGAVEATQRPPYDAIVRNTPLAACLESVHEVHTMTSLVGFEALLRGLPVTTYGQPFYAGWGLTEDRSALSRRQRRHSLDELVAGALLRYPRYYNFDAQSFCTAEQMVAELIKQRARRGPQARALGPLRKARSLLLSLVEWTRAR